MSFVGINECILVDSVMLNNVFDLNESSWLTEDEALEHELIDN